MTNPLNAGDVVRLKVHKSSDLPKGSVGVIEQVEVVPGTYQGRGPHVRVWVEWRRNTADAPHVSVDEVKFVPTEKLTNQQRIWLVKRAMRQATGK